MLAHDVDRMLGPIRLQTTRLAEAIDAIGIAVDPVIRRGAGRVPTDPVLLATAITRGYLLPALVC